MMTKNVEGLFRIIVLEKGHHKYRKEGPEGLAEDFAKGQFSHAKRMGERLVAMLQAEEPVILPNERITLLRTITTMPELYTDEEKEKISQLDYRWWSVGNIAPGYEDVIRNGLEHYRQLAIDKGSLPSITVEQKEWYQVIVKDIEAIYELCRRYQEKAKAEKNAVIVDLLSRLPREGARTFHEACQMFRILHFALWSEGNNQNTVGRFDQYMYPYLAADFQTGRLTTEEAYDLLLEMFLTFNRDSDLYPGVQVGDNGQSLVLGGVDKNGIGCYNLLSKMCLEASRELKVIDPKINLRVNKDTPHEIYMLGTELTKEGLGFPQYCNDDVIIPGLVEMGYELADARDYVVAACWEIIIPKYGMEIPNVDALSFPKVLDVCLHRDLARANSFDEFMVATLEEVRNECKKLVHSAKGLYRPPAPFMSVLMADCLEKGKDISEGNKYNNLGFHGSGISTTADSLAAIRKLVFEEKSVNPQEMVTAVDNDFVGYDELLARLRYECPKMGNNDDYVDSLAVTLLDTYADALKEYRNDRGGRFRAGTGSAMYYIWLVEDLGASPDGRRKGEPLSANYAPSLFARNKGPLSVIQSFTKPDLRKTFNGGPLTMEFSDGLFRDQSSMEKVAQLVEYFVASGGHQLQLNAVNREMLLDAQKHPERHQRLIVRIWGWSGYFVELDEEYQNHVLARQEHKV